MTKNSTIWVLWPEDIKCSPWKVFGNRPPSYTASFELERSYMPAHETVLTLHRPKNSILSFSKFSAEKSLLAWQKNFCTFLANFFGFNLKKICGKTSLHSMSLGDFFRQAGKLCRNLKNDKMSFLGQCNVKIVLCTGI